MAAILIFFVLHWYLSLFAQSFFHHRYAAHRAFSMTPFWEKVFYLYCYITQGSSYMSPRVYGILHRMHHAYTDTELDPHSPAYDKNILSMMVRTSKTYVDILKSRVPLEDRFLKNLPNWRWFDTWGNTMYSRILWSGVYTWFYVAFAPSAWWYLMIPLHIFMGPIHGVIINWFAHKYGEINFETDNTSRNLFRLDLLMLGEGYHNNHHKHPSSSNFAMKKGEFDPCYPVIKAMDKMGIVKLNRKKLTGEPAELMHH